MSVNPVHHDQTKHVKMRYYYVQDMVQRRVVELQFVPTDERIADADYHRWFPPGWQRMGDGSSLSLCIQ